MHIKIPKGSESYILFQRTEYLRMARSKNRLVQFLYKIFLSVSSFNLYVKIEAFLFHKRVSESYDKDMNFEYSTIKNYLPKDAKNVLDIGCGVAGIDAILFTHYYKNLDVYLLDKSAVNHKVFYSFENMGAFYNSLSIAHDLLLLNGVPMEKIYTQEVTNDNKINFQNSFDLVISLISWGFHYPISTYLDQVYSKMQTGGVLIVDVRKETDGEDIIRKKFGTLSVILDEKKYRRILAVKK